MKVAITAQGATADSIVDPRFGRCRTILVCDTETGTLEAHDNAVNLNAAQGAGIQTASNIAALQAAAVLTGHVGPNAYRALTAAGVDIYIGVEGTVSEALEALSAGRLQRAEGPDSQGHGG